MVFPDEIPLSSEIQQFVNSCLRQEWEDRPLAHELLLHSFVTKLPPPAGDDDTLEATLLRRIDAAKLGSRSAPTSLSSTSSSSTLPVTPVTSYTERASSVDDFSLSIDSAPLAAGAALAPSCSLEIQPATPPTVPPQSPPLHSHSDSPASHTSSPHGYADASSPTAPQGYSPPERREPSIDSLNLMRAGSSMSSINSHPEFQEVVLAPSPY